MKLDLGPTRSGYVAPAFGADKETPVDPRLENRMRRPMVIGAGVIGSLVLGLGLWASLTPLSTGITAEAEIRVESNLKAMRNRHGGIVRQILVKEGQSVRAGQPLVLFEDVEPRASFDVLQNQADSYMAQAARLRAESTNQSTLQFPPELLARASDPRVSAMITEQQFLFATRLQLFQSQTSVLQQRLDQIRNQIAGAQAQVASVNEQRKLTAEEMAGYQTLYEKGFAPKPLILRYQRNMAELEGRRGSLLADIARLGQQMGETRMQLVSLRDQRESEAAEQLRDTQAKLADALPRLAAARQALAETVVRSPVDGYVFNLTQFTIGGVASPGELLMNVVPSGTPLVVSAMIQPKDVDEVRVGMDARVRLSGVNQRWVDELDAKVVLVSADRIKDERSQQTYYRADLQVDQKELQNLKKGIKLTPGMPANALIVTGERTVMEFLISPITDTLEDAFREE